MGKKNRLLSLIMGAISSFSITGAKGRNVNDNEIEKNISVSNSFNLGENKSLTQKNENCTPKDKVQDSKKDVNTLSLEDQLLEKVKDVVGNMIALFSSTVEFNELNNSHLDAKDLNMIVKNSFRDSLRRLCERERFSEISQKNADFLFDLFVDDYFFEKLHNLYKEQKFSEMSQLILKKFEAKWENQLISDLQNGLKKVSYGRYDEDGYGCCVHLNKLEDKLGKEHCFDLGEFTYHWDELNKHLFVFSVFDHLLTSDLDKLNNKAYGQKGICDIMKQILINRYVDEVSKCRSKKINPMQISVIRDLSSKLRRIDVPWFKSAIKVVTSWPNPDNRLFGSHNGMHNEWHLFSLPRIKSFFSKKFKKSKTLRYSWIYFELCKQFCN